MQKKIKKRIFSICLGYKKGFTNFGAWNSKSLRIMNYKEVVKNLLNIFAPKASQQRMLTEGIYKASNHFKTFQVDSEIAQLSDAQKRILFESLNVPKNLTITGKIDYIINRGLDEVSKTRLLKAFSMDLRSVENRFRNEYRNKNRKRSWELITKQEAKTMNIYQNLSSTMIIADKIQHAKISNGFGYIYTGNTYFKY